VGRTKDLKTMSPERRYTDRPLALAAFLGSALLAAFWTLYLMGWTTTGEPGDAVADFEAAFPLADALIVVLLLVGGVGLWTGRSVGRFAVISAASMVLYLGVLDLTFYSRHGLFTNPVGESVLQIVVILACLSGGTLALIRCRQLGRTP